MTEFMEALSEHVSHVILELKRAEDRLQDPSAIDILQRAHTRLAQVAQALDGLMKLGALLNQTKLKQPDPEEIKLTIPLSELEEIDIYSLN